jgi:MFS family permease
MQEYVPNAVRGKYAAVSTVLTTVTSIVALAIASRVIESQSGLAGYMILIGLGAIIGIVGVLLMLFVPGGKPIPASPGAPSHVQSMRQAFRENRFFRFYLGGMGFYTLPAFMLASFIPIFMKEELAVPADQIVQIEIYAMVGSTLASIIAGVAADRIGSRKVMMPGYLLTVTIPIGWLLVSFLKLPAVFQPPPTSPGFAPAQAVILAACSGLYFFHGAFASISSIPSVRMLYNNIIPPDNNTPYSALYYAWGGLVGGSGPILAGSLLNALSGWQLGSGAFALDGYRLIFLLSAILFTVSVFFYDRLRPE